MLLCPQYVSQYFWLKFYESEILLLLSNSDYSFMNFFLEWKIFKIEKTLLYESPLNLFLIIFNYFNSYIFSKYFDRINENTFQWSVKSYFLRASIINRFRVFQFQKISKKKKTHTIMQNETRERNIEDFKRFLEENRRGWEKEDGWLERLGLRKGGKDGKRRWFFTLCRWRLNNSSKIVGCIEAAAWLTSCVINDLIDDGNTRRN